jgi:hypothetical protein
LPAAFAIQTNGRFNQEKSSFTVQKTNKQKMIDLCLIIKTQGDVSFENNGTSHVRQHLA